MATDRINVHVVDTTIDIGLTVMDCPNCGVVFGVPKWFDSRRREDGKGFYCHRCPHSAKGGCFECIPDDLQIREMPL